MYSKAKEIFHQLWLQGLAVAFCFAIVLVSDLLLFVVGMSFSPYAVETTIAVRVHDEKALRKASMVFFQWADQEGVQHDSCTSRLKVDEGIQQLTCFLIYPNSTSAIDSSLLLRERMQQESIEWVPWKFADKSELSIPFWALIAYVLVYLLIGIWLIREIDLSADMSRATKALWRHPWLLLMPLLVGSFLINTVALLLGAIVGEPTDLEGFMGGAEPNSQGPLQHLIMDSSTLTIWFVVKVVLLAPFWEEAVFRGWLYARRSAVLPFSVRAVMNAWAFMVVHAFAVGFTMSGFDLTADTGSLTGHASIISWLLYLSVVFCLGLLFYWVRERYDSLTLGMLLHLVNNLAFVLLLLFGLRVDSAAA